ncbi:MAG TPA: hypothetical protein VMX56_00405 [Anaerolineales bacterium]|nr:hypothetical protein [Anaerolineales bacterium]
MKDPRDLEIARVLGWYRIPVQTSPKTVRVDWITFFLTSAFGEEKWSVRYIAKVMGHELVTRGELLREESDHPRTDEPYFKILLGPLLELPRPIPAKKWRRFTFLYTTGEHLTQANDVRDLRVPPSAVRDRLWKLIRERSVGSDEFSMPTMQDHDGKMRGTSENLSTDDSPTRSDNGMSEPPDYFVENREVKE